eukprot:2101448-Amphidinium_carterae.1
MFPTRNITVLKAAIGCGIIIKSFASESQESGILSMRAMRRLRVFTNGIKGTVPESGIRVMKAVMYLRIGKNLVTGRLPES